MPTDRSTVYIFARDGMGSAAASSLRHKLAATFLTLLSESGELPGAICFYTEGVRLACEGSPVVDELQALEARGVRLVLCSTCLEFYGLREQVRVGVVGGMGDILTAMQQAEKVVAL